MKIFQSVSSVAGITALIMLLATPAWAQSEAGRILFSRGVVSIVGEQDSARGGSTGSVIYEGERVTTGRNGIAQLRLSDGALIALRASSDYHIQRQGFDVEGDVYEQTGQLVAGWMRMVTGAIGKKYPGNIKQGTSVATIGIRGTTFQVIHIPEGGLPGYPDTQPGTYLMLEEGAVEVTTDGGKRLLQPGDVIFVPSRDEPPQLAPDKKPLFLNVLDGDATYVDLEESEFSDFTNETLIETLLPTRPFTKAAAVGYGTAFNCCSYNYYSLQEPSPSFTTTGSGASRIMTSLLFSPDIVHLLEALEGASPDSTGYRVLRDGSEINWGVWGEASYTSSEFNANTGAFVDAGNAGRDWHYMMASNVLADPAAVTSTLSGQATYSYVGGTNFMDGAGVATDFGITGGTVAVNFATTEMFFDLATNLNGGNINNNGCTSACTLTEFYGSGISVGNTIYTSGFISGAFVGDGSGIISTIDLSDGAKEFYTGTAAFEGDPDPFVEPTPVP